MLNVTNIYIDDLEDDFYGNWDDELYTFIDNDVCRAFWSGYVFKNVKDRLDTDQYLLYSKEVRHSVDTFLKYKKQILWWTNKLDDLDYDLLTYYEYILNNLVYLNDSDKLTLSVYFGSTYANEEAKKSVI